VVSGAEPAAILKLIKELDAWRRQAISAAKDKNATRAAHWLYAGTLALAASEQLRVDFTAMLDEIDELDASWDKARRDALAIRVRNLGRRRVLVPRLGHCYATLSQVRDDRPAWWTPVVRYFGGQFDQHQAEYLVSQLAAHANNTLEWVGARTHEATPIGMADVEQAIRRRRRGVGRESQARRTELTVASVGNRSPRGERGSRRATRPRGEGLRSPATTEYRDRVAHRRV
jgi:hypothetical protein